MRLKNQQKIYGIHLVYLTLNKGHIEFSTLDLGGLEMAIMLAAKDHGVDSIPAYFNIMFLIYKLK